MVQIIWHCHCLLTILTRHHNKKEEDGNTQGFTTIPKEFQASFPEVKESLKSGSWEVPTTIKWMNFITTFPTSLILSNVQKKKNSDDTFYFKLISVTNGINVTFCSLQSFPSKNLFDYDILHANLSSLTCCTLCSFSCVSFKIIITTLGALEL